MLISRNKNSLIFISSYIFLIFIFSSLAMRNIIDEFIFIIAIYCLFISMFFCASIYFFIAFYRLRHGIKMIIFSISISFLTIVVLRASSEFQLIIDSLFIKYIDKNLIESWSPTGSWVSSDEQHKIGFTEIYGTGFLSTHQTAYLVKIDGKLLPNMKEKIINEFNKKYSESGCVARYRHIEDSFFVSVISC